MDPHSFMSKLFDFSFKEFISLQIVRYLYILGIVISGISALGMVVAGFSSMQYAFLPGLGKVLFSPLFFLVSVIFIRLVLEALVATFRIAENTTIIARRYQNDDE